MHGRGKYWYYNLTSTSVLFVGELNENVFSGLGKMVFRDGAIYYGSFVNNNMFSKKGVLYFPNGDKFKGSIERGQRNGAGEFRSNDGKRIYEGTFKDDLRDGHATYTV